ncbi:quinolinate synthase NadA [Nibribacter koreensis]|uniref:Quinolinate synthase n=1 Tax=Nibribacter koreensis TaxID=1084519 RepID=A0ABP8FHP4_9BACT
MTIAELQEKYKQTASLTNLTDEQLQSEILRLKQEKNAVILAHYYQEWKIQEIADYVGDSLGLSQQAAMTNADVIVFAGVHFMAETAKILSPQKKVLLPDLEAGCSLADSCPTEAFQQFKDAHPGHVVVSYVNCTAEIKALSDIICTSSNAKKIIDSIPVDTPIIFAPDVNLGRYLKKVTGRDLVLWDGACIVHDSFSLDKIQALQTQHPDAKILAHPECSHAILEIADYVDSTANMLDYSQKNAASTFIVVTEEGILHQMRKASPEKLFLPAPLVTYTECACGECPYMRINTLEKLYLCLLREDPAIELPEELRLKALAPIQRMLELS